MIVVARRTVRVMNGFLCSDTARPSRCLRPQLGFGALMAGGLALLVGSEVVETGRTPLQVLLQRGDNGRSRKGGGSGAGGNEGGAYAALGNEEDDEEGEELSQMIGRRGAPL